MLGIKDWNDIKASYHRGNLILGNGASMAVHRGFGYGDLYQEAKNRDCLGDAEIVFEEFDTSDFELVLRHLLHSLIVIEALSLKGNGVDKIKAAYTSVRDALITTVQATHVSYDIAAVSFDQISNFLRGFETVFSLNYDLIVYWAIQYHNRKKPYSFKDCFERGGFFGDNWQDKRDSYNGVKEPTLVFYPHGNLVLGLNNDSLESKIAVSSQQNLLEQVFDEWRNGVVPLFVCEGTAESKIQSIQSSNYMSRVYYEPLTEKSESLVLYGWAMGEQDNHIVKRAISSKPSRIAISVYGADQDLMYKARRKFESLIDSGSTLEFFDSQSSGAWSNL